MSKKGCTLSRQPAQKPKISYESSWPSNADPPSLILITCFFGKELCHFRKANWSPTRKGICMFSTAALEVIP